MADLSPILGRQNAGDLEFVDKASGNVVFAYRHAVGSLPCVSSADALTALASGGQPGATPITTQIARFTTVANAGDSAILPASTPGLELTVINAAAVNSMNVFPATGDKINALSANSAFAIAATKVVTFYCTVAGQWHTQLTA